VMHCVAVCCSVLHLLHVLQRDAGQGPCVCRLHIQTISFMWVPLGFSRLFLELSFSTRCMRILPCGSRIVPCVMW